MFFESQGSKAGQITCSFYWVKILGAEGLPLLLGAEMSLKKTGTAWRQELLDFLVGKPLEGNAFRTLHTLENLEADFANDVARKKVFLSKIEEPRNQVTRNGLLAPLRSM